MYTLHNSECCIIQWYNTTGIIPQFIHPHLYSRAELISDDLTHACVTGVATLGLNRRSWLATSMAALGGVAMASCPCCCNSALAAEDWEYGQPCGPKQWGGTCASGRRQSPIDVPLKQVLAGEGLGELVFDYNAGVPEFVNTGHGTMQVSLQILR